MNVFWEVWLTYDATQFQTLKLFHNQIIFNTHKIKFKNVLFAKVKYANNVWLALDSSSKYRLLVFIFTMQSNVTIVKIHESLSDSYEKRIYNSIWKGCQTSTKRSRQTFFYKVRFFEEPTFILCPWKNSFIINGPSAKCIPHYL